MFSFNISLFLPRGEFLRFEREGGDCRYHRDIRKILDTRYGGQFRRLKRNDVV